jgi:hypothetical protein
MPVILDIQEAEMRRIAVQSQPGQINSWQDPISKKKSKLSKKKRADGVAQGVGPEFKPQNHVHTEKKVYGLLTTVELPPIFEVTLFHLCFKRKPPLYCRRIRMRWAGSEERKENSTRKHQRNSRTPVTLPAIVSIPL